MAHKAGNWIKRVRPNGKLRTVESMGIQAIGLAVVEGATFTSLNVLGQAGRHVSYAANQATQVVEPN